ncbi:MAG: ANTAR domain-containing protein [Synergistaceae bacterium]|jgi:response regulator NasT|nr:ANTAR domain-containing protein [Synergistaceae bacterium]
MRKVIIVDDEPITRIDLASMLNELGFSVEGEASDGFDAVEMCTAKHPDLVLMDIKMPIFDGLSAAEIILRDGLADCVVLLTAYCDAQFIERANQIGVTGYLVKPINKRLLMPAIEVAYSQSQRLKDIRLEAESARQKLEESRIIEKAKVLVAKELGISEGDAYRELQRLSMNKRCSLRYIAETVIERNSEREIINRAKQILIQQEGVSEQSAYKRLNALSKGRNISMTEAAQHILSKGANK